MTPFAVRLRRFLCEDRCPPDDVDSYRDRLQMIRVQAIVDAAEMVQRQIFRDRSSQEFPGYPMSWAALTGVAKPELPISSIGGCSNPEPARPEIRATFRHGTVSIYVRPKTGDLLFRGILGKGHRGSSKTMLSLGAGTFARPRLHQSILSLPACRIQARAAAMRIIPSDLRPTSQSVVSLPEERPGTPASTGIRH